MNKKGEGQWGLFFGLAIGGVAAILVILFFSGFFGSVNKGLETFTPEQVDIKFLACQGFTSPDFKDTFCEFQEIEKATYINCELPELKIRLQENTDLNIVTCDAESEVAFCKEKRNAGKDGKFNDEMTVNGLPCYKKDGNATEHWDIKSS